MERRTFLYSVPLGLLSFKSLAVSMTSPCGSTFEGLVEPFFNLFGAKPAHIFFEDNTLESLIQVHTASLVHIGYTVPKATKIWEKDNRLAFVPLTLGSEDSGILDVVILVLRYSDQRSAWEHAGSLNGFQIESMLRIPFDTFLPNSDKDTLQEWLLPSSKGKASPTDGWSYKTIRGKYQTKVNIQEGQTIIDSALYDKDKMSWSEQYISKHSLCKASTFII